jgi:hypothetical protein
MTRWDCLASFSARAPHLAVLSRLERPPVDAGGSAAIALGTMTFTMSALPGTSALLRRPTWRSNQHVIASGNAPKLDVSGATEGISLMSAMGH